MTEKTIQNAILRYLSTVPGLRAWRQNTGVARYGQQVVRFGIPGQADITGIYNGIRLEIECKSTTGKQTPPQAAFQRMIENHGGIYILARSVEDVRRVIDEQRNV